MMSSTPTAACGYMTMRWQGNHLDVKLSRMQLYCGQGDQDEMRRNFDRELKARLEASDIPGLLNNMAMYAEREPKTVYIQAVHAPNAHDARGAAQAFVNAVREKLLELAGHSFARHKQYTLEVPKQPFIPTSSRPFAWPSYTYDKNGNPVYPEPVFKEAPPVHISPDGTRTEGWAEAKAAREAEMLSLRQAANPEHKAAKRSTPYVRFQDRMDQGQDTDRFGLLDIFNPIINLYNLANTIWDQVQFKELYKSFDRNVTSADDVQELSLGVIDHLGDSLNDLVELVDFLKEAADQAKLYFMTLGKEGSLEPFALLIKGILVQIWDLITMWFDKQLPDSVAEDIIATFNAIALATSPRELGRGLGKFIQYIIEKIGPGRIKAMVAKAGKKLSLKKGAKRGGPESKDKRTIDEEKAKKAEEKKLMSDPKVINAQKVWGNDFPNWLERYKRLKEHPVPQKNHYEGIIKREQIEHILLGDEPGRGGHLPPPAFGKTPFPEHWTPEQIIDNVVDILLDPKLPLKQQSGKKGAMMTQGKKSDSKPVKFITYGERDGVWLRVVCEPYTSNDGRGIVTAFPKNPPPGWDK